jgi:hypothetical protein
LKALWSGDTRTARWEEEREESTMKPYWLARDEGYAVWMFDSLDTIKADADQTAAV